VPRGVSKQIRDYMEAREEPEPPKAGGRRGKGGKADRPAELPANARPEQIVKEIKRLEGEMFRHARNLEFEEAAAIRDRIEKLKVRELGLAG